MAQNNRKAGFSLIECLLAATILSIVAWAVLTPIVSSHMQMREALDSRRAESLAEDLLGRIRSLPYDDPQGGGGPGPEPGETTPDLYDNMDDFHGYVEAAGQLKDAAGDLLPEEYQGFSRRVGVSYGSVTVAALGGSIPGCHVTVTVTASTGKSWSVGRFVAAGARVGSN